MAIQPWLPRAEKRARIIEAHGYYRKPPPGGEHLCFLAGSLETVDPAAVRALKDVLPEMAADWIFEVWRYVRPYEDPAEIDPHEVADFLDVPLQAVVATLLKLEEWGVLRREDRLS